jgi:hypothetical protein
MTLAGARDNLPALHLDFGTNTAERTDAVVALSSRRVQRPVVTHGLNTIYYVAHGSRARYLMSLT